MCCCLAGMTVQSLRLSLMDRPPGEIKHKAEYMVYDEAYLFTPFGISTEFWVDVVNYFFYGFFIFMIDNNFSYRNFILYWSGATLASEIVATLACFTGSHSHELQYSELMHAVRFLAAIWVIIKFVVLNPRCMDGKRCRTRFAWLDRFLIVSLILLSFFAVLRGLGSLDSNQILVKQYILQFEPYIAHPSRFPCIWILYLAVYGIPFQLLAARILKWPDVNAEWLINCSILYAGSVLQGTFVFLSYTFYPSAELKFKTPANSIFFVVIINFYLVLVAHLLAYRCMKDPYYFIKPSLSTSLRKGKK